MFPIPKISSKKLTALAQRIQLFYLQHRLDSRTSPADNDDINANISALDEGNPTRLIGQNISWKNFKHEDAPTA